MKTRIKNAFRFLWDLYMDFCSCDMFVYSANATLWLVMAIFPLIILALSILRLFPLLDPELLHEFMKELFPAIPVVDELVTKIAAELEDQSTAVVSLISGAVTLVSASSGIFAVIKGLARLNGITKQNWMKYRFISLGYTLGLLILIILTLGSKLSGGIILGLIHSQLELKSLRLISGTVISILQYCHIITLIGTFLMAWGLYLFPFDKAVRLRSLIPGAVFASVAWFVAGKLFTFYITRFWKNSVVYGSLTAVVLIILWFYMMAVILFLGAALNKALLNKKIIRSKPNK